MSDIFQKDPGTKNKIPQKEGIFDLTSYSNEITEAISLIDPTKISFCSKAIRSALEKNKQVIFVGNGGSHAIAEHMACDYGKGLKRHFREKIKVSSLGSNNALSSAIANDFGYENLFSADLEMIASSGDVLVAISSSGNSPNIINAIKKSKEMNIHSIGLSGFDGGDLKNLSDISIHIDLENYPGVEFLHQYCLDLICISLFEF